MKKLFTLIELIVVIVILGILTAIVVPNISSWQKESTNTAISSNIRNMQTSVDMYSLDNQGNLPVEDVTEFNPKAIPFDKLNPKQLRNFPKTKGVKYWIDAWGKVWGSYVDAPIIESADNKTLVWKKVEGASKYNIYEIKGYKGSKNLITSSLKTTSLFQVDEVNHTVGRETFQTSEVEVGKAYVVSAVDEYGFETAPAGEGYKGYESMNDKEALYVEYFREETYKGIETTANWLTGSLKTTTSEVLLEDITSGDDFYNSIIPDGEGGFIAVGHQGYNKRYGLITRFDSNLNEVERKTSGSNYTGFVWNDIVKDNDGNYVIVGKEVDNYIEGGDVHKESPYILKVDSNLKGIKSLLVANYRDYYDSPLNQIIQNKDGNYVVSGERGGQWCQKVWIIEFSKDFNILQQNYEDDMCNARMSVPIVQDNEGNYILVRERSDYKATIQKLGPDFKWVSRKTDDIGRRFTGLVKNSKGNLVAVGYTSKSEFYIAEFDNNLNKIDFHILNGISSSQYTDVIVNADGGYTAVGHSNRADMTSLGGNVGKGDNDFIISLYNENLDFLTLYNTGSSSADFGDRIIQDVNKDYIMLGRTRGDLSSIGGNKKENFSPYQDFAIMRYKGKEGFNVTNNILQSKSIDLKGLKSTIKTDVDITLPEGTNYKLYISTDNSNWRQVPLEYSNSGKEFGLGSSTQYIYWKIELQGTSIMTPTVNKIKIY